METVYDALSILMNISRNAQDTFREEKKDWGTLTWLKELCLIRACTARRGGHTTAALDLIVYNNMNIGYLCSSMNMAKTFIDELNRVLDNKYSGDWASRYYESGNLEFCSSYKEGLFFLKGTSSPFLEAIVVDTSFNLTKEEEEAIYSMAVLLFSQSSSRYFFLIFLQ